MHIQRRENKAVGFFWNVQDAAQVQVTTGTKSPNDFLEHCASGVAADLTYLPPHEITMLCCSGYGNCL